MKKSIDGSYIVFFDDPTKKIEEVRQVLIDFGAENDITISHELPVLGMLIIDMEHEIAEKMSHETGLVVSPNTTKFTCDEDQMD